MALQALEFHEEPEPFAPSVLQSTCDPTPKPGVEAFRDFVLSHQGGLDLGITRECEKGGTSEHKEGRAWDWAMSVTKPAEAERVDELLQWLLDNDAEMFRRAGLQYVIWNKKIWSSSTKHWREYTGSNDHTTHVHFSFSWPGAKAETSLYRALGNHPAFPGSSILVRGVAVVVAAALGWFGFRAASKLRLKA